MAFNEEEFLIERGRLDPLLIFNPLSIVRSVKINKFRKTGELFNRS